MKALSPFQDTVHDARGEHSVADRRSHSCATLRFRFPWGASVAAGDGGVKGRILSDEQERVAEANRAYYSKTARLYETTETCVTDPRAQAMLLEDIDSILSIHLRGAKALRCLDACGGSGNAALKMMARGAHVTVCDVSEDLLALLKQKADVLGFSPTIVCSEIAKFLSGEMPAFDLIVFSSALHHLPEIAPVLTLACARLKDGGLLYTVFDPTSRSELSRAARGLVTADYLAFKLLRQTRDLPSAVIRRMRRARASRTSTGYGAAAKRNLPLSDENLGVLAEYHVEAGIDDQALVKQLESLGMDVIWHARDAEARFGLTRRLLSGMEQPTNFKLLMRKSSRPGAPGLDRS